MIIFLFTIGKVLIGVDQFIEIDANQCQLDQLNRLEKLQKFNLDHTDTVLAMAVHPTGKLIATGEAGRVPKVVVWDADTQQTVSTMRGFHQCGVAYSLNSSFAVPPTNLT